MTGQKQKEATKEKIRIAMKAYYQTEAGKEKIKRLAKRSMTEENKDKVRFRNRSRKRKRQMKTLVRERLTWGCEFKFKFKEINKVLDETLAWYKPKKEITEEHKNKISKANKGRKLSEATCNKMSASRSGEKHWNWQGGKSFERYPQEFDGVLRENIRKRDNYICQECGLTAEEERKTRRRSLSVHHIDYDKSNCSEANLIALCTTCHTKTNSNREYWQEILSSRREVKCQI